MLSSHELGATIEEFSVELRNFLRTGEDFEIDGKRTRTWSIFTDLQIEGLNFLKALTKKKAGEVVNTTAPAAEEPKPNIPANQQGPVYFGFISQS